MLFAEGFSNDSRSFFSSEFTDVMEEEDGPFLKMLRRAEAAFSVEESIWDGDKSVIFATFDECSFLTLKIWISNSGVCFHCNLEWIDEFLEMRWKMRFNYFPSYQLTYNEFSVKIVMNKSYRDKYIAVKDDRYWILLCKISCSWRK